MKPLLATGFVLLTLAGQAVAQITTPADYYFQKQRADSLFRVAHLAETEPIYRQLLAYSDWDGQVWFSYARALEAQHKDTEAIVAYEKALERGGSLGGTTMYAIARLEARLGDAESAKAWLRRALDNQMPSRQLLRTDTVFTPLRSDPEFQKLAGIPPANLTRDQKWQFDVDYFVAEAKRLHASFQRQAFSPAFDSLAALIRARIPQLNDDQIISELRRLVVLLDDGHSGVYLMNAWRLPLVLYWFKDGVFVMRDVTDSAEKRVRSDTTLLGSRVVAVEGVPVDSAMRRLYPFIPRDNDMGLRAGAPALLGSRPNLRNAGLLKDTTSLLLTVRTLNGRPRNVRVRFIDPIVVAQRLNAGAQDSTRPDWLRNVGKPYWMKTLPDIDAVYLQFNAVQNIPAQPIARFAKLMEDTLRATGAHSLIVDVRFNGGGNSYVFPPFIKMMVAFREASPDNRVFVITGRQTFSAAQNFSTAIDQQVGAIFVGEPTGSRINFTGESEAFPLPVSGLRANVSWRWHQYGQWVDQRKWIAPQIPAEMTSDDYFAGRDVALAAIRAVIQAQRR